jgi:hypothetical protein
VVKNKGITSISSSLFECAKLFGDLLSFELVNQFRSESPAAATADDPMKRLMRESYLADAQALGQVQSMVHELSRSPKSFAHSNSDELMLVIPLFLATCGLWSDPDDPASFVGGRLFSIGPHFTAVFSRFRAVLGIAP